MPRRFYADCLMQFLQMLFQKQVQVLLWAAGGGSRGRCRDAHSGAEGPNLYAALTGGQAGVAQELPRQVGGALFLSQGHDDGLYD